MAIRLQGLVAAAFTPMHDDGSVNLEAVGPLVERLAADGVSGLFVCGSTGEGPLLTREERMATAAAYVEAARGRLPVVVHVGHASLAEARALAAHAQSIGADAISAAPPWYIRPATVDVLVDCLAEITAAADRLPFYYYHIPSLTGVNLDLCELLERAGDRIGTLAGVKYTAAEIDRYQQLVELNGGRFDILFGRDEMLLSGLAAGAQGAIGSTYNFAAPLYLRLIDAFRSGDMVTARRHQSLAVRAIHILLKHRGQPAFKAMMRLAGIDCGRCRLPHVSLDEGETEQLRAELEAIGFLAAARGCE